jgi:hypothetical protein
MTKERIRVELSKKAVEELIALANAADKLPRILGAAEQAAPQVGTVALARCLSDVVEITVDDLRLVLVALLNLYFTQVKLKLSTAETIEVISANLRRVSKSPEDLEKLPTWDTARTKIVEAASQLNSDHPIIACHKAFRVASSREYELVGMKIFTDARPVFNEVGDTIIQTVISHVLSLDYHDGEDHHVIQFNLDATHITELRRISERAEKKAGVLKNDLKRMDWPTSIFREQVRSDIPDDKQE